MIRWIYVICVPIILASNLAFSAVCEDEVAIVESALIFEAGMDEPQNLEMATELYDEAVEACDSYNFGEPQDVDFDGNQHAIQLLTIVNEVLSIAGE